MIKEIALIVLVSVLTPAAAVGFAWFILINN